MAAASTKRIPSKKIDLEAFIESVRKYRCLYDKTEKEYKDTVFKSAIWTAIGAARNMTMVEAEKKWKVQRERYMKEKKWVKEGKPTGTGAGEIYVTNWALYPIMDSILRGCYHQAEKTVTNDSSESFSQFNNNYEGVIGDVDDDRELDDEREADKDMSQCESQCESRSEGQSEIQSEIQSEASFSTMQKPQAFIQKKWPQKRQKIKSSDSTPLNEALKSFSMTSGALNSYLTTQSTSSQEAVPDRISKYCSLLESKLRNLDSRDCFDTMNLIDQLLVEKEGQEKYFP